MPYIIDGHNLIHYLDDIQLDDPHDEAKLVIKLRGFCARTRKKCVVIFDEGLPGGTSSLSTPSVKVVFAASRQSNADRIIRERIRLTRDVKGWIVVSSDNEILDEARAVGMKGLKCADFADMLMRPLRNKLDRSENPHVIVSEAEVLEFLQLFGVDDTDESDVELPIIPGELPVAAAIDSPAHDNPAPQTRAENNPTPPVADDVDGWLEIFGEEPNREPTEKAAKITPRDVQKKPKKGQPSEASADENLKESDLMLPKNTVDAWMKVFGAEDKEREPTDPNPQRFVPSMQGRFKNKDGKREPTVHKRMATSDEIFLNAGEVDAWMDVFGVTDEDDE